MSHVIVKVFDNTNIRITYAENGDVLFIAKDVAEALGYSRPRDAITAHCKRRRRITAPSAGVTKRWLPSLSQMYTAWLCVASWNLLRNSKTG